MVIPMPRYIAMYKEKSPIKSFKFFFHLSNKSFIRFQLSELLVDSLIWTRCGEQRVNVR